MQTKYDQKRILSVPNVLTAFRILLIIPILLFYFVSEDLTAVIIMLVLSGLTDVLDGFIARKFNQITDLGKILDPIADKLTQGTLLICLAFRYERVWALICIFVIKEVAVGVLGLLVMKRADRVAGSQWYGKVCTAAILVILGALVFFPLLSETVVYTLTTVCAGLVLFSFFMYAKFFISILRSERVEKTKVTIRQ